ncbi:hypothetical protein BCU97_08025 [Vibrio splendidus]|uniref:DUF6701 domain-containing protein n=1 Tax=Vibrio splendidus TaxID=29497 RepID=UPI000C84B41B|nr:DUF6701 domain-containing protein [Vibrio splendidus]PMG38793.1 hypothetical protein BCU97_08025 [Vibrio splendidus]
MKLLSLTLFLLISISTSSLTYASTCLTNGSSVDARNGFCVTFNLNSDGSNRIRLENSQYFPMWTDDDDFDGYYQQIFDEDYIDDGTARQFQVKFERTSNFNARWISGKLTYSVDGIQKQVTNGFDLSYATGADKFNPFVTIRVIGDAFTDNSQYCISTEGCNTLEPPSKPLFEFGQVNASDCSGYTCNFDFNTDFKTTPIVVLMSSYDINDQSSAMFVTSVARDRAELKQRFPLSSDPHRMEPIYYFAAEVGDIVLDDSQPGKIVHIRKVELSNFQTAGNTRGGSWKRETYSERFNTTPVVFSQVQPDSGKDFWVTTAHTSVGKSSFKIALEFGRQNVPNSASNRRRTVGYIAAPEFSGQTSEGVKFTFQKPTDSYDQDVSLAQSCIDNQVPHGQPFDSFGVIAQKQTRTGPDGGWLRVCDISSRDYFTFVLEEDASNRLHQASEHIGFFAFEQTAPRPPIEKCDYFPEMLQSNRYRPGSSPGEWIPWDGILNISSGNGSGNNIYLNQLSKSEAIGFSSSNVSGIGACVYKDGQNNGGSCTVSDTKNLFPFGVPDTATFSGSGEPLIASGNNGVTSVDGDVDGYEFTSLSFSANNSTVIFSPGEYWIDTINFDHNDSYIKVEGDGPVVIHYNHINFFQKSRIYINAGMNNQSDPDSNYDHNKLTFIGHGALSAFWPQNGSDIRLNANVYIPPEAASTGFDVNNVARFQMTGAITAPRVTFRARDTSYIKAQGLAGCYTPTEPTIKYIEIEPNNYHLTCDDTAQVYVTPYDDNDQPMDNVDGETVSISASGVTFSGGSFDSQNKRFVFDIDSRDGNQYGAIPVTANVVGTAIEDNSDLIFVPLKFEINNEEYIELIGGKKEGLIPIKALACDNTGKPISLGYSVDLDENNITQTQFTPNLGDTTSLELDAKLANGEGNVSIKFDESGLFEGDLKAPISCDDFPNAQDCPEKTIKEVVGKVKFKARPWKFAICTNKSSNGNSNDDGSDSFSAAGDIFDVYARPIKYTNSSSVCSDDNLLTNNYFKSTASVKVTTTLDTPLIADYPDAELGDLTPETQLIKQISSNDQSNKGYKFESLKYSEVGSFNFVATETGSFYGAILGGFSGNKSIGRFYPKYFQVIDQNWKYSGIQMFNYMNQNFEQVSFDVQALSKEISINGGAEEPQPVHNYQYFAPKLKTSFSLYEIKLSTRLISPSFGDGAWSGANQSIGRFSVNLSGECGGNNSFCLTKADTGIEYEDGPYNLNEGTSGDTTDIRLAVEDNVDPVEFWNDGDQLLKEPDIRFGRIDLDDVGGNSGTTIAIPLRAEYWDSSRKRFVLNDDDSTTRVDASTSASDVIWSEDDSKNTAILADGGQVSDGESRNLTASQGEDVSIREQVQLWQSMDGTPWLRYDWDSDKVPDVNGEQDPSTVVTFGIYRGNDRVIYRGESGLTGQ